MLKCEEHGDPPVREDVLLGLHVLEEPDQEGRRHVERQVADKCERGQRPVHPVRHLERGEELCDGCNQSDRVAPSGSVPKMQLILFDNSAAFCSQKSKSCFSCIQPYTGRFLEDSNRKCS